MFQGASVWICNTNNNLPYLCFNSNSSLITVMQFCNIRLVHDPRLNITCEQSLPTSIFPHYVFFFVLYLFWLHKLKVRPTQGLDAKWERRTLYSHLCGDSRRHNTWLSSILQPVQQKNSSGNQTHQKNWPMPPRGRIIGCGWRGVCNDEGLTMGHTPRFDHAVVGLNQQRVTCDKWPKYPVSHRNHKGLWHLVLSFKPSYPNPNHSD